MWPILHDSVHSEGLHTSACSSVASVMTGVFANFPNKIAKITGKFENVNQAKNRGVLCQH